MEIVARNRYLTTDGHTAHVSFKDGNGHWCGWIEGKNRAALPAVWDAGGVEIDHYPRPRTWPPQNIICEWRKLLSFTAWVGAYTVLCGPIGDRTEVEFTPLQLYGPDILAADMRASGKKFMAIAPVVIEPGAGSEFLGWKKEQDK